MSTFPPKRGVDRRNENLVFGALWLVCGLLVTGLTYALGSNGGMYFIAIGPIAVGIFRLLRGLFSAVSSNDDDLSTAGARPSGPGLFAGPFPLALALRYLRMPRPRTWKLYLVPLVIAVILTGIAIGNRVASHSKDLHIMGLHAEWVRIIGYVLWGASVLLVLVWTFVLAIRHLTIFTTISTYGMFLGCAALVIVMSVMSGFEDDIKSKILGSHAHVVITRTEDTFTDWAERLRELKREPGVLAVTPFLSSEATIASPGNRSNVVVKGIEPSTVGSVTDLRRNMELGDLDDLLHPEKIHAAEPLDEDDDEHDDGPGSEKRMIAQDAQRRAPPGIIVGRELAKSLRVYVGDDVSLVSPTGGIGPNGSTPKARPYRVAGIFFSGMFEYDSNFVYVALGSAQKLFDQPDEVTGIELKVPDSDHTETVVAALTKKLGPAYEVADWKSLNRSLFSALALEKIVMFVFLSFIILVAAFSIVANGQMLATRKMAEIAILKSMGATNGTIALAFILLGGFLGGLGVLAGVVGGVAGAQALHVWGFALDPDVFYLTSLPVRIEQHEIMVVAIAGILVTTVATLYPAWSAARLTPVEGLRAGAR